MISPDVALIQARMGLANPALETILRSTQSSFLKAADAGDTSLAKFGLDRLASAVKREPTPANAGAQALFDEATTSLGHAQAAVKELAPTRTLVDRLFGLTEPMSPAQVDALRRAAGPLAR